MMLYPGGRSRRLMPKIFVVDATVEIRAPVEAVDKASQYPVPLLYEYY
jgi:hypothetical protein